MRVKFMGILSEEAALKAVESDGYALQYVLDLRLFLKIAAHFGISVDVPKVDGAA